MMCMSWVPVRICWVNMWKNPRIIVWHVVYMLPFYYCVGNFLLIFCEILFCELFLTELYRINCSFCVITVFSLMPESSCCTSYMVLSSTTYLISQNNMIYPAHITPMNIIPGYLVESLGELWNYAYPKSIGINGKFGFFRRLMVFLF
jgi:hypothetical protein